MASVIRGSDNFDSAGIVDGAAKAWVHFTGTGTVTVNNSYNVTSITDNGTGDYDVNFTNAMSAATYSVVASAGRNAADEVVICGQSGNGTYSTAAVAIICQSDGGVKEDAPRISVAVFGDLA